MTRYLIALAIALQPSLSSGCDQQEQDGRYYYHGPDYYDRQRKRDEFQRSFFSAVSRGDAVEAARLYAQVCPGRRFGFDMGFASSCMPYAVSFDCEGFLYDRYSDARLPAGCSRSRTP
jgi:hypothetical protein